MGAALAFLKPFLPFIWKCVAVFALVFAIGVGVGMWKHSLINQGVTRERAVWVAKDLEQKAKNEKTRADRAEAALAESHRNAVTTEKIKELFQDFTAKQTARAHVLERQLAISNDALFAAMPVGGDPCRIYVTPQFIDAHNVMEPP